MGVVTWLGEGQKEAGKSEGRGKCGWDVLFERRIYFQEKERFKYLDIHKLFLSLDKIPIV
jgi:hypothetical protein